MYTSSTLNYRAPRLPEARPAPRSELALDSLVPVAGFLGVLLLAIGLLSAWGIKHIDDAYSSLISQTALDLERLHDVSYHSGMGFATAIELASTPDPARRPALLRALAEERAANDAVFAELRRNTADPRLRSGLDEVLAKRDVFASRTDEFIRTVSGPATTAKADSVPMLEAFLAYQKASDHLTDLIRDKSLQTSGQFTEDARKFRLLFSAAGILPILLGVFGILATIDYVRVTPPEADFKD